jgi:chromate transporter
MQAPSSGELDATVGEARITPWVLFVAFSRMALSGFGGVMPFAYRALVERLGWVSPAEFAELLAMGQVLPGPTICNVSVLVGWRKAGLAGAAAALGGMMIGPFCITLSLGIAYAHYGDQPHVHEALSGMAAVAAGLIMATAVKLGQPLFLTKGPTRTQLLLRALFALGAFAGVGLFRWPLIAVVAVLAPVSVAIAWWRQRQ